MRDLLNKLYSVFDEILSRAGIEDRDAAAQTTNKFIHCHSAFQHTKAVATFLSKALDGIWGSFSELGRMGFPSPFLEDGSIATTIQIVEVIKQKENNLEAFREFSSSPTTTNIEVVIHPLSQLLFHIQAGVGLFNVLPQKEAIDLRGAQENLHSITKPSENEWSPLQAALSKL